jgi:hypothetical protein
LYGPFFSCKQNKEDAWLDQIVDVYLEWRGPLAERKIGTIIGKMNFPPKMHFPRKMHFLHVKNVGFHAKCERN